jgi:hypothetical protein
METYAIDESLGRAFGICLPTIRRKSSSDASPGASGSG